MWLYIFLNLKISQKAYIYTLIILYLMIKYIQDKTNVQIVFTASIILIVCYCRKPIHENLLKWKYFIPFLLEQMKFSNMISPSDIVFGYRMAYYCDNITRKKWRLTKQYFIRKTRGNGLYHSIIILTEWFFRSQTNRVKIK